MNQLQKITAAPEEVLLAKADALKVYTSAFDRRLIKSASEPALMDLPERERNQRVGKMLVWIFKDLGISKELDPYDAVRLLGFIELHHPKLTALDLHTAFEYFLAGRFAEALGPKHDHYQSFSVAFYSKIFRAYTQEQSEARHRVRNKVQEAQKALAAPSTPPEVTEHLSLSAMRDHVVTCIENGTVRIPMVGYMFDCFVRHGLLRPVSPPTQEELADALKRMKQNKGAAVAFTWKMQRLLAGERLDDVEWEATAAKRERALLQAMQERGPALLVKIDALIARVKARAVRQGIKLEPAA